MTLVSFAAVFWDVTQRSPPLGGALRDIPKSAAKETRMTCTQRRYRSNNENVLFVRKHECYVYI